MTKFLYITIISMLCALLFLNMRCKKENEMDPNGLPKATRVGSLLFACKINGENWTSNKNSYSVSGGVKNGIITVSGFNDSNSARALEYLQIQVKEVA
ncbi:hypothetical protein ABDD95_00800 [Mucilaginibacter sp. PAMB04274]|uniref:hypothetical protein n=1 Tax=Mucilaginibacter sp. PAMB04274 TaxID=3138568 RepID=UPI0031F668C4